MPACNWKWQMVNGKDPQDWHFAIFHLPFSVAGRDGRLPLDLEPQCGLATARRFGDGAEVV
jgi:hypothetical protein